MKIRLYREKEREGGNIEESGVCFLDVHLNLDHLEWNERLLPYGEDWREGSLRVSRKCISSSLKRVPH